MAKVDWSAIEREVFATLRSKRWPSDQAQDLAQTAVERAIRGGASDWPAKQATAWCVRVALNAGVDERRHQARFTSDAAVPDLAAPRYTDEIVLARLELEAVARALPKLSDRDRELLLAGDCATDRRGQVRDAVARHRARARLRVLIDRTWAWIVSTPVYRALNSLGKMLGVHDGIAVAIVAGITTIGPTYVENFGGGRHHHRRDHLPTAATAAHAVSSTRSRVELRAVDSSEVEEPGAPADRGPQRGDGAPRGHIEDPFGGAPGGLWYWEDDPEHDDEPVECVWSEVVAKYVCTPTTWGDVRRLSPVPPPNPPW